MAAELLPLGPPAVVGTLTTSLGLLTGGVCALGGAVRIFETMFVFYSEVAPQFAFLAAEAGLASEAFAKFNYHCAKLTAEAARLHHDLGLRWAQATTTSARRALQSRVDLVVEAGVMALVKDGLGLGFGGMLLRAYPLGAWHTMTQVWANAVEVMAQVDLNTAQQVLTEVQNQAPSFAPELSAEAVVLPAVPVAGGGLSCGSAVAATVVGILGFALWLVALCVTGGGGPAPGA